MFKNLLNKLKINECDLCGKHSFTMNLKTCQGCGNLICKKCNKEKFCDCSERWDHEFDSSLL